MQAGLAPYVICLSECFLTYFICTFQIPDTKLGTSSVNAVLVDEDAVGSVDASGCGAKILLGDGALEQFLRETRSKDFMVCS